MKKRIVSLVLVLAMLMAMLPMGVLSADAASYSGTCGDDMTWELDTGTGVLTISGVDDMDNYTADDEAWDYYRDYIKTVIITDGVTSIGRYAFDNCVNLTSVEIPESVETIEGYAFNNCVNLTSVEIPEGMETIWGYAFYNCVNLTSVTIPDSVTTIGTSAFEDCDSLTSVEIPADVYTIGSGAFAWCSSLASVTIRCERVGSDMFVGCENLTSVELSDDVTSIGDGAFVACYSLTSITLPDSVTSIDDGAFSRATSLRHIHFLGDMPTIGNTAFSDCASDLKLCYMEGTEGWENCTYAAEPWDYTATEHCPNVTYTCNDCGESYTKKFDPPKHSCLSAVDNGDGTHSGPCSCGEAITEEHRFVNGSCICGVVGGSCGDNVNWSFNTSTGVLTIYGVGDMDNLISIAEAWDYYRDDIKTAIIKDGVTSIGDHAFSSCSNLTSFTIPDSVTYIGTFAFSSSSLTSITIPNSVTSIGASAFIFCDSLTSVEIPDSVTYIGAFAFANCRNLTSIKISDGVTDISESMFQNCPRLRSITIPDSVTTIGEGAFNRGTSLLHVHFLGDMPTIGSEAFDACSSDLKLCYMEGTEGWENCTYATEPWDYTATEHCPNVTYTCKGCRGSYTKKFDPPKHSCLSAVDNGDGTHSGPCSCGDAITEEHRFVNGSCICGVVGGSCGDNVNWSFNTSTGVLAIYGKGDMKNYVDNNTEWESYRFDIKTVVITDGVTSIGDYAFSNCYSLMSVEIPDSVTSIGKYVFYCCYDLISVTIGDGVTSIGVGVFLGCDSLTGIWVSSENEYYASDDSGVLFNKDKTTLVQVPGAYRGDYVIPDSVTGIGDNAFKYCSSLTGITIPDGVTSIGDNAFDSCYKLTSVEIPDSVAGIGDSAFFYCNSLISVAIPDSVTIIGNYAFYNCKSLTSIEIPDSVTHIGDYAFYNCKSLTSVEIHDSVASIGVSVFSYCSSLISVAIPDSVTGIGNYAFHNCSSLTSITLPDSVTTIGERAFSRATSLRHIHFLGDMPTIGSNAFESCSSDLKLCYMEGTKGWENCTYAMEPWDYTATEHCPNITYTCNDCGGSYTVKSDSPNHSCLNAVNNGDGTHSGTCSCGEAITEEHRFVNGSCICGAVEITQPILDASLTFGAQLYLENDLTMAFRVKADKLSKYDISTAYLVVERDVYASGAANAVVETMTLDECKVENGRLIFSYPGIAAAQMNDAIRVTLYIKDAKGQEYVSPVLNTSVATYLDGLLTASASDAKLVTLVMDMVNYGAAAQIYFSRHADAPVNEAFESFKTYASYASADFRTALENLSATENAEGKSGKLNLSLDLGTRIGIQYKVTVPADVNVEDVTVVVTDSNGNVLETLTVAGNATDSRGRYLVNFYGSTSKDMRRVVYATAYAKGKAITGTYAYSISSYAWGVQENAGTQPADLVNVTRAMLLYGDSAAAYFG